VHSGFLHRSLEIELIVADALMLAANTNMAVKSTLAKIALMAFLLHLSMSSKPSPALRYRFYPMDRRKVL
jgi:hypothetical protein